MEQLVARQVHTLEVDGSNPSPAIISEGPVLVREGDC